MTKDRTLIAKGTVRNRHLIRADNAKDRKRILTYTTAAKARAAFERYGFYTYGANLDFSPNGDWFRENLEAVPVSLTLEILPE